ncbi:MAG: RNA-binding S4 domain-containing protein [Kordiimonadaceae bacterium]|nr:RNA-binding S4 domain-containing protein [Kordiimonadaceae bacterium]
MALGVLKIRVDKWLWQARFFKTRTLASKLCRSGKMRVNGERVTKASVAIAIGDVLTFPQKRAIRVVELLALGERRGPAPEAQALYDDQSPVVLTVSEAKKMAAQTGAVAIRDAGAGRPTKAERRATEKLKGEGDLDFII